MLFRQHALASENSANITPKQTEKVEASAEIAESSASTKNCPSTSAGVPSQCDDTHSNHDSSDDNQSSDGSQSTQDTCLSFFLSLYTAWRSLSSIIGRCTVPVVQNKPVVVLICLNH